MSLNDILKSINDSTENELKKLNQKNEETLDKLRAEYNEKLLVTKANLLKQVKIDIDRKVSQASFEAKSVINNQVLMQKREVLTEIYKKALDKLSSLSETDYEKLLVKLLKELPKLEKGEIIPAEGSEEAIKNATTVAKSSYQVSSKSTKNLGGFIFISEGLEINNTLEKVINNLQEQIETEVAQILFS